MLLPSISEKYNLVSIKQSAHCLKQVLAHKYSNNINHIREPEPDQKINSSSRKAAEIYFIHSTLGQPFTSKRKKYATVKMIKSKKPYAKKVRDSMVREKENKRPSKAQQLKGMKKISTPSNTVSRIKQRKLIPGKEGKNNKQEQTAGELKSH